MQPSCRVAAPMVVSTIQTPQRKEHYMSKCVLGLSVTQIVIGVLCIPLQVVLIFSNSPAALIGTGIWTGILFILTGSSGIASSMRKTTCFIVTFLVLAIISALITIGLIMLSIMDIDMNIGGYYYRNSINASRSVVIGIDAILIFLAVAQAILAIISSAFSCHGLCGWNQNQPRMVAGRVHYIPGPNGQQQMVILPFDQQGAALPAGPSCNPVQTHLPPYDESPPPTYESSETYKATHF